MPRKNKPDTEPEVTQDARWLFFGDSLTDNGLLNEISSEFLTRDVPFTEGGYSESFTNGTVYADTWMALEGVAPEDYENFAIGGAEAKGTQTVLEVVAPYEQYGLIAPGADFIVSDPDSPYAGQYIGDWNINLTGQVDRYLQFYDDDPAAYSTASILIGFNDIGNFGFNFWDFYLNNQSDRFAEGIGQSIEDGARRLAADGVDRIVLSTLPEANFFSFYDDLNFIEADVADTLLDSISDEIEDRATALEASGIDVELVRIEQVAAELIRDPGSFGFATNEPLLRGTASDPSWQEVSPGVWEPVFALNPDADLSLRMDQRIFYDEIHPTETMHDTLAIFTAKSVALDERFLSDGSNTANGTHGLDMIFGRDGNDRVTFRREDDIGFGGRGNDTMEGNLGNDLLIGGAGNDSLDGGSNDDLLTGSRGADYLNGGRGDDILIGGTDGDVLEGSGGADIFVFLDPELTADSDSLGGTVLGDSRDTLLLVLGETNAALVGPTANAQDLALLGLDVSGVRDIQVIDYAALDSLSFNAELDVLWQEAQLWNIV